MGENQTFCSGCGARLNQDIAFCPQCGIKITPRQDQYQPPLQPQSVPQQGQYQQPLQGRQPQRQGGQYQQPGMQGQPQHSQTQYGQPQRQGGQYQQPGMQGQPQHSQTQNGQPQQQYTQGYQANMPQYQQGQYFQQDVPPYPARKKSGGGKAIAVLIILALLGVGGWWLYKNVLPGIFNTSNVKALSADRINGEYTGTATMTSAKGTGSEAYEDVMNEETGLSFTLTLNEDGAGRAVFSEIYAGMGDMDAEYEKGSLTMSYRIESVKIEYTGTAKNIDGFINFSGNYSVKVENGPEMNGKWKVERTTALTDGDLEALNRSSDASQASGGGSPANIEDIMGFWEGTLSYTEYVGLNEDDSISQEEKDRIKGMLNKPFKLQVGIYDEDGGSMAGFTVYDDEEDQESSTEIGTGPVEYNKGKFSCHFVDSGVDVTFTGTVKNDTIKGTFVAVPEEPMGSVQSVEGSFNVSFKSKDLPE